jgi:hypothetical protein
MMQQYFLSVEDHVFSSAAVAPWQSTNEVVEVVLLPAAAVVVVLHAALVVLGDGAGASALVTQPRPSWKQHHVFFASDQPDSHLA